MRGEKIYQNNQIITVDNILETDNLNKFRQSISTPSSPVRRNERKEEEVVGRQVHLEDSETGIQIRSYKKPKIWRTRNKARGHKIEKTEGKKEKREGEAEQKFTAQAIQNKDRDRKTSVTTRVQRHTSNFRISILEQNKNKKKTNRKRNVGWGGVANCHLKKLQILQKLFINIMLRRDIT
ncbi:hypothetical protein WA026_021961 [Henosepilachna vigintioctopunctata]|uniref:Uncharacterized protein n=1 Tax=Henosepilachna vigintioctopunctata TaxID=420089 RepID=A0AAW1VIK4_9CUCU